MANNQRAAEVLVYRAFFFACSLSEEAHTRGKHYNGVYCPKIAFRELSIYLSSAQPIPSCVFRLISLLDLAQLMSSCDGDSFGADRRHVDVAYLITAWVSQRRSIGNLRHFTTAECFCNNAERLHPWHGHGDDVYNAQGGHARCDHPRWLFLAMCLRPFEDCMRVAVTHSHARAGAPVFISNP
jgi:hypothetical protein